MSSQKRKAKKRKRKGNGKTEKGKGGHMQNSLRAGSIIVCMCMCVHMCFCVRHGRVSRKAAACLWFPFSSSSWWGQGCSVQLCAPACLSGCAHVLTPPPGVWVSIHPSCTVAVYTVHLVQAGQGIYPLAVQRHDKQLVTHFSFKLDPMVTGELSKNLPLDPPSPHRGCSAGIKLMGHWVSLSIYWLRSWK